MELFISITGQAATGKTTIAKIIEDALRDKGFKVLQNDVDLTSQLPTTKVVGLFNSTFIEEL